MKTFEIKLNATGFPWNDEIQSGGEETGEAEHFHFKWNKTHRGVISWYFQCGSTSTPSVDSTFLSLQHSGTPQKYSCLLYLLQFIHTALIKILARPVQANNSSSHTLWCDGERFATKY